MFIFELFLPHNLFFSSHEPHKIVPCVQKQTLTEVEAMSGESELADSNTLRTTEIDQSALSRQLAVWDVKSQVKVSQSTIFISGLNGLGLEIAKNLCLAGVKGLTIHDDNLATAKAANSNFYISRVGTSPDANRAEATLPRLSTLNPNVTVELAKGGLQTSYESLVVGHTAVVLCDAPLDTQLLVNDFCRSKGIKFISADVRGVFAWAFTDFGDSFFTSDKDGEPLKELMVSYTQFKQTLNFLTP